MKIRLSDPQPPVAAVACEPAPFDAEKVARIAQAIRDGRFTIDPEAIADRLLADVGPLRAGWLH